MKRIVGIILGIAAVGNLILLTFGFRDFSFQIGLMFVIVLLGLPLSTYLLIQKKTYFLTFNKEDDDVLDVVGKFSI